MPPLVTCTSLARSRSS
uniref:Uncharacterized protein n=1 Tax=Arundo donax TaxID=35708 RepID=A0A0A8ZIT6_ARUDO